MQSYRDLQVWRKAHSLTCDVYQQTKSWPADERFGLTSQVRRAASSIGANLAEGSGRFGKPEFARFAQIALGSACELDYHLLLARDLGYLTPTDQEQLERDLAEIRRMLVGLLQKLQSPDASRQT